MTQSSRKNFTNHLWIREEAQKYRESISSPSLPVGCKICKISFYRSTAIDVVKKGMGRPPTQLVCPKLELLWGPKTQSQGSGIGFLGSKIAGKFLEDE